MAAFQRLKHFEDHCTYSTYRTTVVRLSSIEHGSATGPTGKLFTHLHSHSTHSLITIVLLGLVINQMTLDTRSPAGPEF